MNDAVVLLSSRYDLVTQNKNWNDAHLYCEMEYRAKLVVINSMADQLRLQSYLETINGQQTCCFIPRDAMLARYVLSSCVRLYVRPSVCLSVR